MAQQRHPAHRGQSLVEFALVFPLLLLFFMAIVDGGRAIFAFNGSSEAARNVARVASLNCFATTTRCDASTGPIQAAIASQQFSLPGTDTWTVTCLDPMTGAPPSGRPCKVGDTVRVNVSVSFELATPIVSNAFGHVNVGSTSQQQILQ